MDNTTVGNNYTDIEDYLLFQFENISAQIFTDEDDLCKIENSKVTTKTLPKDGKF